MSLVWSIFSFSPERFDSFFGGDAPDAEEVVVQAVTWDEEAWDDPMLPAHVARHVARTGLGYEGLSPTEKLLLDELVPILFGPEGMAEDLRVEDCGIEGLTPGAVRDLLDRGSKKENPGTLSAFLKGRRAGGSSDFRCGYVLLDLAGVTNLRDEIQTLLGKKDDDVFRRELLPLLDELIEDGQGLAAFLA